MNNKLPGLELGRFIAALIVSLGHLLFVESKVTNWANSHSILNIFKYGEDSVSFFFILSGFVLAPHGKYVLKSASLWLKSRLIRLMPIYFLTYLIPLLSYIFFTRGKLPNGILGIFLSIFGIQSFSKAHYIDLPNPPLWSLSVEIVLSFCFVFLFRLRLFLVLMLAFLTFTVNKYIWNSPIVDGLSFFCIGLGLSKSNLINQFKYRSTRWIACLIILILIPGILNFHVVIFDQKINRIISLSLLLLLLASFQMGKCLVKLSIFLGERTYSLYACHFPILVFINYGVYNRKEFMHDSFVYITVLIILISAITEITYRFVEKPSIRKSREIRIGIFEKNKTR